MGSKIITYKKIKSTHIRITGTWVKVCQRGFGISMLGFAPKFGCICNLDFGPDFKVDPTLSRELE